MKKSILFTALGILYLGQIQLSGQETIVNESISQKADDKSSEFYIGTSLVSRYVWRGSDFGNSPGIQPCMEFSVKGFTIGAWGSYGFFNQQVEGDFGQTVNLGNYSEIDLYVSYTRNWFTVLVNDYYVQDGLVPNGGSNYFDWDNSTTGHALEGSLIFEGLDNFPLRFSVSTMFYGADKNKDEDGVYGLGSKNNFSTYLEAQYTFNLERSGIELSPLIGGSLFGSSLYGDKAGIINLGLTAARDIPISEKFSLPIGASLITNPKAKSIFLVFSVTLE
jgi:hypothetical protein